MFLWSRNTWTPSEDEYPSPFVGSLHKSAVVPTTVGTGNTNTNTNKNTNTKTQIKIKIQIQTQIHNYPKVL